MREHRARGREQEAAGAVDDVVPAEKDRRRPDEQHPGHGDDEGPAVRGSEPDRGECDHRDVQARHRRHATQKDAAGSFQVLWRLRHDLRDFPHRLARHRAVEVGEDIRPMERGSHDRVEHAEEPADVEEHDHRHAVLQQITPASADHDQREGGQQLEQPRAVVQAVPRGRIDRQPRKVRQQRAFDAPVERVPPLGRASRSA